MRFSRHIIYHAFAISVFVIAIHTWGKLAYQDKQTSILFSSLGVAICFFVCVLLLPRPKPPILKRKRYPLLAILLGSYCIHIVLIAFLRIDYSRPVLLMGFSFTFIWFLVFRYFQTKNMRLVLHRFSTASPERFAAFPSIELLETNEKTEVTEISLGVVSDFHKPLSDSDTRLLAECSLHGIPIYHADLLIERLSKQISTDKLNPVSIALFNPNPTYLIVKQALESLLILLTLPLSCPLAIVTAIAIKLNSLEEPVLYKQQRAGFKGRTFTMYKFRSMSSTEDSDEAFATSEQHRVDKLGAWLRKTRLDELPQFLNVLKGEMALIGPRPEQPGLAAQFQARIPFYSYRHTVKPGITGWAQTEQGYTDTHEATSKKLGYDLYYIKNLSINLDMYILLKTIKVVLFGKGI